MVSPGEASSTLAGASGLSDAAVLLLTELRTVHKGRTTFNAKRLWTHEGLVSDLKHIGTTVDTVMHELVQKRVLANPKGTTYERGPTARKVEHGFRDAWAEMQTAADSAEGLSPDAIPRVRGWLSIRASQPTP